MVDRRWQPEGYRQPKNHLGIRGDVVFHLDMTKSVGL
jgi:hypothetical protein